MGLFFSSPCLGIGLCRMNLSIALGCVHPEQCKTTPAADASLVHVLSLTGGKSLCSVSCLLESLIMKERIRCQILYCRNGLRGGGGWGRDPQKCIFQSSFVTLLWGLLRVSFLQEPLFVCFNFVFFAGGLGKGPGDELHNHQIQRDDDYGRWLETRLSVCLPDPSPDSCWLRWLQPKIWVWNQPSV